jgi:hypothetical protein
MAGTVVKVFLDRVRRRTVLRILRRADDRHRVDPVERLLNTESGVAAVNQVFRKLQLKDQERILLLGAPGEFTTHIDEMREEMQVAID